MSAVVPTPPVIELKDVTFRRDGREILDRVSFTVGMGEHWVMLGPNGAGKSTILGFCGANSFPTTGTVDLLGHRLGRVELQALRREIGHVNPRHPLQSPLSITEVVLTGLTGTIELMMRWQPDAEQLAHARELIEMLGLGGKASHRWTTLSQGERGRALIARALIAQPRLLLLDEPSTGLDVAAREQLLETIDLLDTTHPGLASVLVTHHLEEIPETTSHAVLLSHGGVVASGEVSEVLRSDLVTRAFEYPISVDRVDGRWSARTSRARERALR